MNLTNRLFKLRVEVDRVHREDEDGNCVVCFIKTSDSILPQPYPCPTKKLIIDSSKED